MEVMQKMFGYITAREDILIMLWERESGFHTATKRFSRKKYRYRSFTGIS